MIMARLSCDVRHVLAEVGASNTDRVRYICQLVGEWIDGEASPATSVEQMEVIPKGGR